MGWKVLRGHWITHDLPDLHNDCRHPMLSADSRFSTVRNIHVHIWICCQKQVSQAGIIITSHSTLRDVITYPCLRYLLLATKSSNISRLMSSAWGIMREERHWWRHNGARISTADNLLWCWIRLSNTVSTRWFRPYWRDAWNFNAVETF